MSVAVGPRSLLARLSNAQLADLLAPMVPTCTRERSTVELRWCTTCVGYMLEGSAPLGRCRVCGTRRPVTHERP